MVKTDCHNYTEFNVRLGYRRPFTKKNKTEVHYVCCSRYISIGVCGSTLGWYLRPQHLSLCIQTPSFCIPILPRSKSLHFLILHLVKGSLCLAHKYNTVSVFAYLFLRYFWRQDFTLQLKLPSNSCQPPCFSFTSTGIPSMCHHTWILLFKKKSQDHTSLFSYYLISLVCNSSTIPLLIASKIYFCSCGQSMLVNARLVHAGRELTTPAPILLFPFLISSPNAHSSPKQVYQGYPSFAVY